MPALRPQPLLRHISILRRIAAAGLNVLLHAAARRIPAGVTAAALAVPLVFVAGGGAWGLLGKGGFRILVGRPRTAFLDVGRR